MSGICSAHQGHNPRCNHCTARGAKGIDKWALGDLEQHPIKPLRPLTVSEIEDLTLEAYQRGFQAARNKAAGMIESFNNPKFNGVPLLIRAIGEGRADFNPND